MTPTEIANRLVELCRGGEHAKAQAELYANDAVSIEPEGVPNNVSKGREALAAKVVYWEKCFEVHENICGDPIVAGPFFSVRMGADVTEKESGKRFTMEEIAVFQVKEGKIVSEQFFYPPEG